jgi:hypothetical protein
MASNQPAAMAIIGPARHHATNNFLYCLAVAAERSGGEILLACAMSNHYQAVVYFLPARREGWHFTARSTTRHRAVCGVGRGA